MKMKQIRLIYAIFAGALMLSSCNKEEAYQAIPVNQASSTQDKTDYDDYIDKLISSTGVDIYQISKLNGLQQFANKNLRILDIADEFLYQKDGLTQSKIIQIQNLADSIQMAYNTGNYETVLVLYDALCAICRTIDGFVFDVNEYGLQTVIYDPEKKPVSLPINQMQDKRLRMLQLKDDIRKVDPKFSTLSENTQVEILAAAFYLNLGKEAKEPPTSCKSQAKRDMVITLSWLTAAYIIGASACMGTFVAFWHVKG